MMKDREGSAALALIAARPALLPQPRWNNDPDCIIERTVSGAHALELAFDTKPDVVLLDAELPDMSGLEVCRTLRQTKSFSRMVPILLIVPGNPSPEQRLEALEAGIWDFVRAPVDSE